MVDIGDDNVPKLLLEDVNLDPGRNLGTVEVKNRTMNSGLHSTRQVNELDRGEYHRIAIQRPGQAL